MSTNTLTYHLGGKDGKERTLQESDDMFIIRTKDNLDPKILFEKYLSNTEKAAIVDKPLDFPEASVFVYKINGRDLPSLRSRIKSVLSESKDDRIDFVGSVMIDQMNKAYQIDTGNIYLEFKARIIESIKASLLSKYKLKTKLSLSNNSSSLFLEPLENQGRGVFALCNKILGEASVFSCYPELVVKRRALKTTTKTKSNVKTDASWAKDMIHLEKAWKVNKGEGVKICIIDDGIDYEHPAFQGSKIFSSKDMLDKEGHQKANHKFKSEYHGTAVASVAASNDEKALGIAPEAQLIIVRSKGLGSVLEAEAIIWAVDQGADIISCSWGPPDRSLIDQSEESQFYPIPDHTRKAIDYAAQKGRNGRGCLVIFAAGNGAEQIKYDGYAKYKNVIAIGSVNKEKQLTKYSDRGHHAFCCFPSSEITIGKDIATIYGLTAADRIGGLGYDPSDYITTFGGTSASAPGMAGIAAMLFSICPEISLWDARKLLAESCKMPNGEVLTVEDENYGWGIINAHAVVQKALEKNTEIMSNLQKTNGLAVHIALNKVDAEAYAGTGITELSGCVNDGKKYENLLRKYGFDPRLLVDSEATRDNISFALNDLTKRAKAGDTVFISYSGHGGVVEDENGDELDLQDETLCLYDGMWLDDQTKDIFHKFVEGVRVIWISDSCHSGTNTRNFMRSTTTTTTTDRRERNFDNAQKQYDNHAETYRNIIGRLDHTPQELKDSKFKARIMTIAACQDDQLALEIKSDGLFTSAFFNALANNHDKSIRELESEISKYIKEHAGSHSQNIRIELNGGNGEAIDEIPLSKLLVVNIPSSNSDLVTTQQPEKVFIKSNELIASGALLLDEDPTTDHPVIYHENARALRGARNSANKAWDEAYKYILENNSGYVEPDLASVINSDPAEAMRSIDADAYLDTYPSPSQGFANRFTWHLSKEYSQLSAAARLACPELAVDLPKDKDDYPLIVHIDTGIIPDHPSLPRFYDEYLSNNFTDPTDYDAKFLGKIAEQKGHGHATITLLAGRGFDTDLPDDDIMPDYIGAFPYARVVTLKISETVILLRGKSFAKAVYYAIKQKADVISMSMAGAPSKRMVRAINKAYEAGIVVVAAAGNNWSKGGKQLAPKPMLYPARFGRVIAAVGTTFDKTPYLNEFNKKRGVGSRYMQSCYGPATAMSSALAAYTPNTTWVSSIQGKMYSRQGGGTSSATPQIAAAAALYLHHFKDFFNNPKNISQGNEWKKVEYVRKALFDSADKSSKYHEYYGNGILKAREALSKDPNGLNIADKTPEDSIGLSGIDEILGLWFGRTRSKDGHDKNIKDLKDMEEMIATEIHQIVSVDDKLSHDQLDNVLTYGLANKLISNSNTSSFLKKLLKFKFSSNTSTRGIDDGLIPIHTLDDEKGHIRYWATQNPTTVAQRHHTLLDDANLKVTTIEMDFSDIGMTKSTATFDLGFSTSKEDNHAHLITVELDDGSVQARWIFASNIEDQQTRSKSSSERKSVFLEKDQIFTSLMDDEISNTRGVGRWLKSLKKVIKKIVLTVVQIIKDEPRSGLNGLIYADVNNLASWGPVDNTVKLTKQKNILLLHGTWSYTQSSFKELLASDKFINHVKKQGYKNVLGFDMSTIKEGVKKNSTDLLKAITDYSIDTKNLNVIAFSRGCLVARKTFNKDTNMVLVAGPHQGTPLAKEENMIKLLNRVTNMFLLYHGPGAPILAPIVKFAQFIGRRIFHSPGLLDQAPESSVIKDLSKTTNALYVGSNYQPDENAFIQLRDKAIDSVIFKRINNDGVIPTRSSLNIDDTNYASFTSNDVFATSDDVGHFGYFKNEKVIEKVIEKIDRKPIGQSTTKSK